MYSEEKMGVNSPYWLGRVGRALRQTVRSFTPSHARRRAPLHYTYFFRRVVALYVFIHDFDELCHDVVAL
jgi:hypothetical protein